MADLLAFVASARSLDSEDNSSDYIDSFGSYCLSVFRALGLPSTAVLIRVSIFLHLLSFAFCFVLLETCGRNFKSLELSVII